MASPSTTTPHTTFNTSTECLPRMQHPHPPGSPIAPSTSSAKSPDSISASSSKKCSPIPSHLLRNGANINNKRGIRQQQLMNDAEAEAEFLHAVDFGDVSLVKRLLQQHPNIDVDCVDGLGRTPLRLAVKSENKDLVEILLGVSNPNDIHESLLQAIDAGFTTIAETTLRHPRYMEAVLRRRRMGDTDGFFTPEHGSQFPSYVTPLNLAAQKEQFVIVKLLLQRGETIRRPHWFSCPCQECINKNKFDQLRMAKCRLDAYRGLASEAYISLNFLDPILTAMELAQELKKQAENELHFKIEYNELVERISSYMVKLLDRVWTYQELNIVLDKTGTPWEDKYESLARLKMAVDYEQKKFVSHPNCQQRIVQRWYKGTSKFSMAKWNQKMVIVVLAFLAFPLAVLVFLVKPNSKFARFLHLPTVKFISHALSYFILLALIIYSSTETEMQISSSITLRTTYPHLHTRYSHYRNQTGRYACGHDFPVRNSHPAVTEVMLNVWITALIAQECQELWRSGLLSHVQDYYNFMDFLLLSVYTASFTLGHFVKNRVVGAVAYLQTEQDITKDPDVTESHIYWLNADRRFWHMTDPINMMEGLFAMANILTFTRISYLLPANEVLGPLQISLGRMVTDVFRFLSMSAMVIAGFMVSLRNLFWYYANRREIELDPDKIDDPTAVKYYGSVKATFRTVFWAIFGRGGTKAVSLGGYNNTVTEQIGIAIDGLYHITMIILLLNIFIAMMTRSFEQIAADEDVEWKFARSSLYLDYISEGRLLPVPLNILEIFRSMVCHCIGSAKALHPCKHPIQRVRKSYSERRRPAMISTKSTKDKIKRHFVTYESTEMATIDRHPSSDGNIGIRKNRPQSKRTTEYQEVMQRIVHRYIMDLQRQNEDGGNADEIKSSIETMKSEVFTNYRQKDENLAIAAEAMNNVAFDLGKMADGDFDTNQFNSTCALLIDWWEGGKVGGAFEDDVTQTMNDDNVFEDDVIQTMNDDVILFRNDDDFKDPTASNGSTENCFNKPGASTESSVSNEQSIVQKVDVEIEDDVRERTQPAEGLGGGFLEGAGVSPFGEEEGIVDGVCVGESRDVILERRGSPELFGAEIEDGDSILDDIVGYVRFEAVDEEDHGVVEGEKGTREAEEESKIQDT